MDTALWKKSDILISSKIGYQNTNINSKCNRSFSLSSNNDSDNNEDVTNDSDNDEHARIFPYLSQNNNEIFNDKTKYKSVMQNLWHSAANASPVKSKKI